MPAYLVERYWPGVTVEQFLAAVRRGRHVMEQTSGEGTCVRDVSCTLIPRVEVVLAVHEGPVAAAVREQRTRWQSG